jgi:hypothetical protein
MKWLILLLILLIPVVFVAVRYRRQLLMGWQMYQMYRRMKLAGKPPAEKRIQEKSGDKSVPLIRCERCGSWVSQTEALKLRSNTFYCSANCMERAVKLQSMVD